MPLKCKRNNSKKPKPHAFSLIQRKDKCGLMNPMDPVMIR